MCLSADENDPDYGTDGRLVVVVDGRIEEPWGGEGEGEKRSR